MKNLSSKSSKCIDLLYLDYNCFQRSFDDPNQTRIQIEALACQEIFERGEHGKVKLVWSFMHQDETNICPFPERKQEAFQLAKNCHLRIGPDGEVYAAAKDLQQDFGLASKDAIHVACADFVDADFFITCDDRLLKKAKKIKSELIFMNPVDYIRIGNLSNED